MRGSLPLRRKRALIVTLCGLLTLFVAAVPLATWAHGVQTTSRSAAVRPAPPSASALRQWASDGAWFQRLIYLYASGDAPIQAQAAQAGRAVGLTSAQVKRVSASVRAAWLEMMRADPASLGRVNARPNVTAQQHELARLRAGLQSIVGSHYAAFLATTDQTYVRISSPAWVQSNILGGPTIHQPSPYSILVYATGFTLQGQPQNAQYVALPDAYLKFANNGWNTQIPAIYQPFYLPTPPNGPAPPFTVDIKQTSGTVAASQVIVADVGPWNEDDNWWDAFNPKATIPASCPVSSTLVSSSSLSNAQVDSICPGPRNWRRIAYYLLYQHYALPFFQPAGYLPTGNFADATNWPTRLPEYCPEASAASINNDAVFCGSTPLLTYNGNASGWLRDGSFNHPVLNQAGIDLSPAVQKALGWTYPSSGFINVNVARLP